MQPPKEQPALHVSANLFRRHKNRIAKVLRISVDLRSGVRWRIEEIRELEASSSQTPGAAATREEVYVDARGWKEERHRMTYVAPDGERLYEDVVLFVRGEERLSLDGGKTTPLIPVELFDARQISRKHAVPAPHRKCEIRTVPRVDERGAYLGIYSVMVDAR